MPSKNRPHPPFQPGPLEVLAVSLAHLVAQAERGKSKDWGSLAELSAELAAKLQKKADAER